MTERLKGAFDSDGWRYLLVLIAGAMLAYTRGAMVSGRDEFNQSWWFLGDAAIHWFALMFFALFVQIAAEKLMSYFYQEGFKPKLEMEDYQFLTAVFVMVACTVVFTLAMLPDGWGSDDYEDYRDF